MAVSGDQPGVSVQWSDEGVSIQRTNRGALLGTRRVLTRRVLPNVSVSALAAFYQQAVLLAWAEDDGPDASTVAPA
ncbi:MAG TPA: hypothetical protein VHE78_05385 [Gemmatimonadaceae bacterium]|nr:hypothetical protein [Gemmatimonadaceae bacterium]